MISLFLFLLCHSSRPDSADNPAVKRNPVYKKEKHLTFSTQPKADTSPF
jgi:hypothetical protein